MTMEQKKLEVMALKEKTYHINRMQVLKKAQTTRLHADTTRQGQAQVTFFFGRCDEKGGNGTYRRNVGRGVAEAD